MGVRKMPLYSHLHANNIIKQLPPTTANSVKSVTSHGRDTPVLPPPALAAAQRRHTIQVNMLRSDDNLEDKGPKDGRIKESQVNDTVVTAIFKTAQQEPLKQFILYRRT